MQVVNNHLQKTNNKYFFNAFTNQIKTEGLTLKKRPKLQTKKAKNQTRCVPEAILAVFLRA